MQTCMHWRESSHGDDAARLRVMAVPCRQFAALLMKRGGTLDDRERDVHQKSPAGTRSLEEFTARRSGVVIVLHAFQKKAKRGAETPRPDIELVGNRLRTAEQHYRHVYGEE